MGRSLQEADLLWAETVSGSTGGNPSVSTEAEGTATGEDPANQPVTEAEPDELDRVTAERDEYLDLARRAQAEFENFRKRAARERGELRARTIADVIRELLPVVDNIDRALEAAESGTGDGDALLHGIRLVHGELHGFLDRLGLTAINPAGEKFDPALHEAIASVPSEGVEAGVITDVHQQGFSLDEIVVRPARVVVSA
jgi:molecular chaperone GrpE